MATLMEVTAALAPVLAATAEDSLPPCRCSQAPTGTPQQDDDVAIPGLLDSLSVASVLRVLLQTVVQSTVELLPQGLRSSLSPLAGVQWLQGLADAAGNVTVVDRRRLLAREGISGALFAEDHLFKSLARSGMVRDNRVVWAPREGAAGRIYNAVALSWNVCGHKGVVHGGLSAAIMDETFGYVLYMVSGSGALGPSLDLKRAMTARLEVDYKRPLLANATVVCVAEVLRVEGRKVGLVVARARAGQGSCV